MACDWELTRERYRELIVEKMRWSQEKRQLREAAILLFEKYGEYLRLLPELSTEEEVIAILNDWVERYPFLADSLFECPKCGEGTE